MAEHNSKIEALHRFFEQRLLGEDVELRNKVFKGFIFASSVAMLGALYGLIISDVPIVLISVISGLGAAAVGWVGFIRDLKRDAQPRQGDAR